MNTTPMRILLIDDDELDRKSITRALAKSDLACDIDQASTAVAALDLATKNHYDVILLDYRLPDHDGIEVLHDLRSGKFERVAVIMLSHLDSAAIAERCFERGAQDYLQKDEVSAIRLTRAVRQARQRYAIEEELKNSREQLRDLSEHDALTGLLNRRGFEIVQSKAIETAKRNHGNIAVLLLDLDDFKTINDTLGHDIGDLLLVRISKRLKSIIRDSDRLCRLGGDEFVIVMEDFVHEKQPILLADRIFKILQLPVHLGNIKHYVTASVGIAVFSDLDEGNINLLKCADVAMYQAKKNGRNQSCFYSSKLQKAVESGAKIKNDLIHALENDELKVFYQAQISTLDGTVSGAEALIRWQHPTLGLLSPDAFLPVAEESGLIVEMGYRVLQTSCRQLKQWQQKFPDKCQNLSVAVNLSAIQIRQNNLPAKISAALTENNLNASCLELEITESALITDTHPTITMLELIAKQGVTFSLDDFGTGYSSLNHLKIFPISAIKIDKGFLSAVGTHDKSEKLLAAMIAFARTLGMKVVAEGVETKEQADFCTAHGCNFLQGYYFSKPISAEEFEQKFLTK